MKRKRRRSAPVTMGKRKRWRRDPERKSAVDRGSFVERRLSRITDSAARKLGYFPLYVVYYTRTFGPGERVVPYAFSGMRSLAIQALEKLRSEAYEIRSFTGLGMWKEWHRGLPAIQTRISEIQTQLPRGSSQRERGTRPSHRSGRSARYI